MEKRTVIDTTVVPLETATPLEPEGAALERLSPDLARKYNVIPLSLRGNVLTVAMPRSNPGLVTELEIATRAARVQTRIAPIEEIKNLIRRHYGATHEGTALSIGLNAVTEQTARERMRGIFDDALRLFASDLHFEPNPDGEGGRVRARIDGDLRTIGTFDRTLFSSLVSILKQDARVKTEVKSTFQDGGMKAMSSSGRMIDVRLSTIPFQDGLEKVQLRLLGSAASLRSFEELNLPPAISEAYRRVLAVGSGAHLVCGPTNSGKTSTLLAILQNIDRERKNVCTVEDPVEVQLPWANQVTVNERNGVTFASAVRAFLRQDPDVIMCGEMRDDETATEAMNAALAGRIVFSTIHSVDAIRVIDRLVEFGVRRGTIGSSLRSVMAQRLIRGLCDDCKRPVPTPLALRAQYREQFEDVSTIYEANPGGCPRCAGTGILGRWAIFELFTLNDDIEDAIVHEASRASLYAQALENGYVPMREHAAVMIADGRISHADAMAAAIQLDKAQ